MKHWTYYRRQEAYFTFYYDYNNGINGQPLMIKEKAVARHLFFYTWHGDTICSIRMYNPKNYNHSIYFEARTIHVNITNKGE